MRPLLVPALLLLACPAGAAPQQAGDLLFISPMGEPFRGTREAPPEVAWFNGADTNHDGKLSLGEMIADADRFFKTLDVDGSGEIDPEEITRYETVIAPEVMSGGASLYESDPDTDGPDPSADGPSGTPEYSTSRGAVMYSYLGIPEPVIAADTDFNRGVSLREFESAAQYRFRLLDKNGDGFLTPGELPEPPRRSAKHHR